jgi:hypothetical protein
MLRKGVAADEYQPINQRPRCLLANDGVDVLSGEGDVVGERLAVNVVWAVWLLCLAVLSGGKRQAEHWYPR